MSTAFVRDLIERMTIEEKVGQLCLMSADVAPIGGDAINPVFGLGDPAKRFDEVREGRITGFFNGRGESYLRPLQKVAVEESRLGIPLLFGADVIHGYKTIFPVPLAEAATFDPGIVERSAAAAAREAAADGIHWTFSPGADVCRDPRWGRVVETSGEDPLLAGRMCAARVRGYQGDDLSKPVSLMATVKHFAAYGAAEGGVDYATADISRTTLHAVHLPAFKAAVDAGVSSVMSAFNDVDGVPATANRYLLTDVLRDEWGFQGFVVSDYGSDFEILAHGVAGDAREAALRCFNAGLDMSMHSPVYSDHLAELVRNGQIDDAAVDIAVERVLLAKVALGLFENPYRGLGEDAQATQARAHARDAAAKAIVLLKNDGGVLPLKPSSTVAVIGPLADEHRHLNGPWAFYGENKDSVSVLDGLVAALSADQVFTSPGCGLTEAIVDEIDAALVVADDADIVILALGEGQHMSGESRSQADINLPAAQMELARAVAKLGKPIVLLLRTGRPVPLSELEALSDAVVVSWFLGSESGSAIADVLTGSRSPSGRLPISFPRHAAQIPIYHARKSTGRPATTPPKMFTARLTDVEPGPLFPFGFGLTYGAVEYGKTDVSAQTLDWDGDMTVSCVVTETRGVACVETPQLYIRDVVGSTTRPIRELKGFTQIGLPAGGSTTVEFHITRADLEFWRQDLGWGAEPGAFQAWIAPHAEAGEPAAFELNAPA